jgi:hypothetical protein
VKTFLMHPDKDFDPNQGRLWNAEELTKDLELNVLFGAMSSGDPFLLEVAKGAVLSGLQDPEIIRYRQGILQDCFEHPHVVRELYGIAVQAIESEKRVWGWMSARYPEGTLYRGTEVLEKFLGQLQRLRCIADDEGRGFHSEGFEQFFLMVRRELDDAFLELAREHIKRLQFPSGVLISAELGTDGKGTNYVLRKAPEINKRWIDRVQDWVEELTHSDGAQLTYQVDPHDDAGFKALCDLRVQGIRHVAAAVAQSSDHILSFFKMLRTELGFYVGCLNLRDRLSERKEPLCFPIPGSNAKPALQCEGLYDVCLSLSLTERAVGNDVNADDKPLVMITGANRGGKSTFLRSVGIAQLMMQCGMFVPARSFRAGVCTGIFTHFKREEDAGMKSGKLDEELARMSAIVDHVKLNSIVLLNESFASTNEREGSEIARQIVRALLESRVKVFYVTHLFDLAEGFFRTNQRNVLFLRAERLADGRRTFRVVEGPPQPTSHGEDLYRHVFAQETGSAAD